MPTETNSRSGEPVAADRGSTKRPRMGRPRFKATKDQRRLVRSLAAIGMRHEDIATVVGLRSPKTLRKYFRKELRLGFAEAVAAVTATAYDMAASGNYPDFTHEWLTMMEHTGDLAGVDDYDTPPQREGTCRMIFSNASPSPAEPEGGAYAAEEV